MKKDGKTLGYDILIKQVVKWAVDMATDESERN